MASRYPKHITPTLPDGVFAYRPVLVREDGIETGIKGLGVIVSTPEEVRPLLADIACSDREVFVVFMLNTKNRIIGRTEVSVGSLNASIVHPRELFKAACIMGAASVIVAHNHPSGDSKPSGADVQVTRSLMKAGDVLGIEVLDHLVIGFSFDVQEASLTSMRDRGLI